MTPTKRKPADRTRQGDTRERIVQAAEDAFAYYGFSGASLQDIADRVGIKKASLFYYFKGKEELYAVTIQRVFKSLEEILFQAIQDERSGFQERIALMVGNTFDLLAEHPNYARMLYRELMDNEEGVTEVSAMLFGPLIQTASQFLESGMERGALKRLDPMHYLVSTLAVITFYFISAPMFEPHWKTELLSTKAIKERREQVMTYILNAIVADR